MDQSHGAAAAPQEGERSIRLTQDLVRTRAKRGEPDPGGRSNLSREEGDSPRRSQAFPNRLVEELAERVPVKAVEPHELGDGFRVTWIRLLATDPTRETGIDQSGIT